MCITVPDVVPGTYRVRIESKGFNPQEKQGVLLDANHVVTVDVQLTVGASTTQVEVQGTVPIITTETSTTSYVKTDTQLLDTAVLVRQGNSTQGFVMYNPGVARQRFRKLLRTGGPPDRHVLDQRRDRGNAGPGRVRRIGRRTGHRERRGDQLRAGEFPGGIQGRDYGYDCQQVGH